MCMYFGQVGGRFLAKIIEKDLLVIEILMKRMAQFYRDLSQSSPREETESAKSLRREAGKHSLTSFHGVRSSFNNTHLEGLKIHFGIIVMPRKNSYINIKKTIVTEM